MVCRAYLRASSIDVRDRLVTGTPLVVGHNVGGNAIRTKGVVTFHAGRPIGRPPLPRWLNLLILVLCWPMMARYG